ncbi:unnamed protein product [Diamesa hyperborea]
MSLKGSPKRKPEQTIRYTKTECSSSNKSVDAYFCFVKAYSRSVTTLNFGVNITKPLNFINILHIMEYKYGTIYRSVVETPVFEYCGIMAGISSNIIMNMTMTVLKESVPDLFHECPYSGRLTAYNMTMKVDKLFSIFPSGDYRVHFVLSDKTDPKLFHLTFYHTVRSSIKTSF